MGFVMRKLKVKIISIGHLPPRFNLEAIRDFKSSLFEVDDSFDIYSLDEDSDGEDWAYTDELMLGKIPDNKECDFTFAITTVPLELDWYSRRLNERSIICTFHGVRDYLTQENIPLENMILRVLNAYALVYLRSGKKIPMYDSISNFTHDETRGCLFDMNAYKHDIVESCNNPIICAKCYQNLIDNNIPLNILANVKDDIGKIQKRLYYRITDYVKANPIISLVVSSAFVVMLGIIGSLIASYLFIIIQSGV